MLVSNDRGRSARVVKYAAGISNSLAAKSLPRSGRILTTAAISFRTQQIYFRKSGDLPYEAETYVRGSARTIVAIHDLYLAL